MTGNLLTRSTDNVPVESELTVRGHCTFPVIRTEATIILVYTMGKQCRACEERLEELARAAEAIEGKLVSVVWQRA